MVFHFPMTLRVRGEYGVGQSRTAIVTEGEAEVLGEQPLGLTQGGSEALPDRGGGTSGA